MTYSVAQAAQAIGKSKATVLRAIQAGRISAARDDTGAFRVEPVELHRVFPPLPHDAAHDVPRGSNDAAEARELRARLDAAQDAIRFRDEVIADLRQQRDRVQEQLTAALLTDQRTKPSAGTKLPRSAWGRFLAWRRR